MRGLKFQHGMFSEVIREIGNCASLQSKRCIMINKILLLFCCAILFVGCNDKVEPAITHNDALQAYPNPVTDVANVRVSVPTATTVLAIDPTGKVIFKQDVPPGETNITIDVSKGPSGKYHFVCKAGSTTHSKTLLKL
jgi:hypothetical protein